MGLFDNSVNWMSPSGVNPYDDASFNQRFRGGPSAPLGNPEFQSPIDPAVLASTLARQGIPPPPQDMTPKAALPVPAVDPVRLQGSTWGTEGPPPLGDGLGLPRGTGDTGVAPGGVGAALTGNSPTDIRTPVQKAAEAPTDVSAQSKDKTPGLADVLRGTKMPAGPELQKLGTPAAPRATTAIKGGDLIALLQAMGMNPAAGGGMKLPGTLGEAIRK